MNTFVHVATDLKEPGRRHNYGVVAFYPGIDPSAIMAYNYQMFWIPEELQYYGCSEKTMGKYPHSIIEDDYHGSASKNYMGELLATRPPHEFIKTVMFASKDLDECKEFEDKIIPVAMAQFGKYHAKPGDEHYREGGGLVTNKTYKVFGGICTSGDNNGMRKPGAGAKVSGTNNGASRGGVIDIVTGERHDSYRAADKFYGVTVRAHENFVEKVRAGEVVTPRGMSPNSRKTSPATYGTLHANIDDYEMVLNEGHAIHIGGDHPKVITRGSS